MTAISPRATLPEATILEWDEAAVNTYLISLGLDGYETVIYEHGITGDVLCALDNETLVDLGMSSLGHRLSVLRSVFEIKKEQGIEISEDDWRPQEEVALEAMETAATIERMWNLVLDQQERLLQLEKDHTRLIRALQTSGITLQGLTPSIVEDAATPTTATGGSYQFDSPSHITSGGLTPRPPTLDRLASTDSVRQVAHRHAQRADGQGTSSAPLPSSPIPPVDLHSTPAPSGAAAADGSRAKADAHHQAKSFRVTMEDPCWKVLPAALKKYKINDDWKQYALFICFGNTERCLSYDEKPLLLFQKLKESGHRPVFMLRHIRDIKSPIAVAQQKQAVKLGLPPNSTTDLLPTLESTSVSPTKPTNAGAVPGRTPGEGAFPELPSPGIPAERTAPQTPGTVMDKDGNAHKVTYAIAIYPYVADRQDEFDVAVGATFVVMSKAKGWWFVQKDRNGAGNIISDPSKSAWVPAGCLLELTAPVASMSPQSSDRTPSKALLAPANIMSSSFPGNVLMDYKAKDENELELKEGEKVRVYKKYCHWSYSIKEDTGQRGWVPAWFIGKLPESSANGHHGHGHGRGAHGSPAPAPLLPTTEEKEELK